MQQDRFIDIRDDDNHLLFRIDPVRCIVEVKQKHRPVQYVDLSAFVQPKLSVLPTMTACGQELTPVVDYS